MTFWFLAERAEGFIYNQLERTGLDTKKKERITNLNQLGGTMLQASAGYGPGSAYGKICLSVRRSVCVLCGVFYSQYHNISRFYN